MSALRIEKALPSHNEAIREIYNDVLEKTLAIYDEEPLSELAQAAWLAYRDRGAYPTYVALYEDRVVGFGYFSKFRARAGFNTTAELTLHLSAEMRGRGIGTTLLGFLETEARGLGYHALISAIDEENRISRRLHERAGFSVVGTMPEIANLRGTWRTLLFYQKLLR